MAHARDPTTVNLAVNYSPEAVGLLRQKQIRIDRFKVFPRADVVAAARDECPTYVHFPLSVGTGIGTATENERRQPPDWDRIEALMARTDTPHVNVHLAPRIEDYAGIPADTHDEAHIEMMTEILIRDVRGVVDRFGPERVIVENDHDSQGRHLRLAYLPAVIRSVVEETSCGLLLDLAHARLAASALNCEPCEYIGALPTGCVREIHVSGVQLFDGHWVGRTRQAGIAADTIQRFDGWLVDHLPMTELDWDLIARAMDQVHSGTWGQPWVVTLECGGVGRLYRAVTEKAVLAEQIPRLCALVKRTLPG